MDIGSLMNSEPGGSRTKSQAQAQSSPAKASYTSLSEAPHYNHSPPSQLPVSRERPPQPPPLYTTDSRSPGSSSGYASAQSPYQHTSASNSTLSGGPSAYPFPSPNQSRPGQHHVQGASQGYTSKAVSSAGFAPSPSSNIPQPTTPGPQTPFANQHRPQSSHSAHSSSPSYNYQHPPRESPAPSGPPPPPHNLQTRQFSPYIQHPPQPVTPLGPPASYQRSSPQMQREPEYERSRTFSSGSHSSVPPQDLTHRAASIGQQGPMRDHNTSQYAYERDRERSQSVSPKTIIQTAQIKQHLIRSPQMERSTPSRQSQERAMSEQRSDIMQPAHLTEQLQTPIPMAAPPFSHQRGNSSSQASSTYQSPIAAQNKIQTPRAQNIPLPAHGMSHVSGLKRGSSAISGSSVSPQSSSRKRLRYDEIPIFARSARAEKQKSGKFGGTARLLDRAQPAVATPQIKAEPELRSVKQETNGTAFEPLASAPAQAPSTATAAMPWEASIVNVEPYEDLTRFMCDKMFQIIGSADPPIGGAKFEIEGKLGEIQTHDEQSRLDMPVLTETLIAKDNLRLTRTRFESSMTVGDHKHLNEYLNSCLVRTQKEPNRQIMHYKHTQETDNFYDLSPSGREMLPDHIRKYLNPMFKPRVRITTDLATGMIVAKIIKSRIADFDVYNPRCKFDYRMSISIECPWDGPESHLIMVNEAEGRRGERQKDRMSYRHLAYQVDLTQVTYPQTQKKEHELEIEVAPDALRAEIQLARDGRSNMYESLVRGFIDNIRLLSRQFPSGL